MKRFKFRLEAVEKLRKRREEEALAALGDARRQLQAAIENRENLQNQLQNALIRRERLGSVPTTPEAFQVEEQFISGTKIRIGRALVQENRAKRVVDRATRVLLHARRELMVIEKIRENELLEFRREQALKERKEQDDLSGIRSARLALEAMGDAVEEDAGLADKGVLE